jgi:hypothetical protein
MRVTCQAERCHHTVVDISQAMLDAVKTLIDCVEPLGVTSKCLLDISQNAHDQIFRLFCHRTPYSAATRTGSGCGLAAYS